MQNDKEVASELFYNIKNDTASVKQIDVNEIYSKHFTEKNELLSEVQFKDLGLKEELINSLYIQGFDKPTEIQRLSIPIICSGKDGAFHSKSGTGKTIGFTTGILNQISQGCGPQAIILTPTRELNMQIFAVIQKTADPLNIKVCLALRELEIESISEEIIIGCPAKIVNLILKGILKKDNLKIIVLDEADQIISGRSFGVQTMKLIKEVGNIQKIFFSATYSELSQKAINMISPNGEKHFKTNKKADNIALYYVEMEKNKKIDTLKSLLELLTVAQVIIFVNSKKMVDIIYNVFSADGFTVSKLHGDVPLADRDLTLANFAQAKTKILVTTDVFSRGMDIPQVNLIVNFDLPIDTFGNSIETYIHRIGRSGRFNRKGFVIDFISNGDDLETLVKIQASINETSKKFTIDGLMKTMNEEK